MGQKQLHLGVSPRWLKDVDEVREGLRIRSRSEFIRLAVEAITRKDVVPSPLLSEAIQYIEEVQGHLRGDPTRRRLVATLGDAVTCLTAAGDLELPEDLVWMR